MLPSQRFTLSAFADEISPDLKVQVETLERLGVSGLDLRSVDGVNVLDLSQDDLQRVHDMCGERGLHVQAIGSPVNKVQFDLLNEAREYDRLKKAIRAAHRVNVKRVRIFTPMVPDQLHDQMAEKVIAWMFAQKRLAEGEGIVLIHENDDRYWAAHPTNAKRLMEEIGGENFRFAYDFANTVLQGYRTMKDWFPWIIPYIDTLHIKDAIEESHQIVPAGEGEGQLLEGIEALVEAGWQGPLTIEPHLAAAGPFGGFSGVDLFEVAVNALRGIAAKAGVEFDD
ncbi:MAG: TIM barrel protein [Fimbriimonas sp.]|nr:TIM barrel protein [Fimbriimonas sp.]